MDYFNKKYECMEIGELRALQSARLTALVEKVYESVPAYRAKMDAIGLKPSDIKGIDDISKLPFTTKKDLRDGYPFGMFAAPKKDIVRLHASSGTTGKLTVVGYTKGDIEIWSEVAARSLVCAGASEMSTVHIAYGYGLFTGGLGMHYGTEYLGATAVPASTGNTQRHIQLLKDFGADILCCTPSYALYLAEEIEKAGLTYKDFNLKAGVFGAEPWSEGMRETIENKLHIKAYDIYGLSEIIGPGVAAECGEHNGSHIFEDHFFPEIIDSDTLQPLADGEQGELVITTLTKEGIPLIRYRTRDITSICTGACACGRTLRRIKRITGRSDDMLIIRGVNVFPSQIESVLIKIGGKIAPHYHITLDRVNNTDIMKIAVELAPDFVFDEISKIETLKEQIENDINSAIGISAKIELVSSGTLQRSEGKAKRVTDNRNM